MANYTAPCHLSHSQTPLPTPIPPVPLPSPSPRLWEHRVPRTQSIPLGMAWHPNLDLGANDDTISIANTLYNTLLLVFLSNAWPRHGILDLLYFSALVMPQPFL